jgi:hypothetical protein
MREPSKKRKGEKTRDAPPVSRQGGTAESRGKKTTQEMNERAKEAEFSHRNGQTSNLDGFSITGDND